MEETSRMFGVEKMRQTKLHDALNVFSTFCIFLTLTPLVERPKKTCTDQENAACIGQQLHMQKACLDFENFTF